MIKIQLLERKIHQTNEYFGTPVIPTTIMVMLTSTDSLEATALDV